MAIVDRLAMSNQQVYNAIGIHFLSSFFISLRMRLISMSRMRQFLSALPNSYRIQREFGCGEGELIRKKFLQFYTDVQTGTSAHMTQDPRNDQIGPRDLLNVKLSRHHIYTQQQFTSRNLTMQDQSCPPQHSHEWTSTP